MRQLARLKVTREAILEMLGVRPEHTVVDMEFDSQTLTFSFTLSGPGLPHVPESCAIAYVGLERFQKPARPKRKVEKLDGAFATIRKYLGRMIGLKIVDITQHDEADYLESGKGFVSMQLENGQFIRFIEAEQIVYTDGRREKTLRLVGPEDGL